MWLFPLQGLPGPQGNMGLPGPLGPPGPVVGICNTPNPPLGCSWCLECCLISAHVSIAGPTGCPWAARTSGECVAPHIWLPSVWVLGAAWGAVGPSHPTPLLLPAGGEREARCARQGWCAREGRRGRSAWEDGMMLILPHPRDPHSAQPGCLQLRLRAVLLLAGFTRTFGACWCQGRARGCWSPRAGECRTALSSVPGQDEGEHPRAALLTCPLCPLPRPSLALLEPRERR